MKNWFRRQYESIEVHRVDTKPNKWDVVLVTILLTGSVIHLAVLEFFIEDLTMHWPIGQLLVDIMLVALIPWRKRWPLRVLTLALIIPTVNVAMHHLHGDFPDGNALYADFVTVGTVFSLLTFAYSAFRWLPAERLWRAWPAMLLVFANNMLHHENPAWWQTAGQAVINWLLLFSAAMAVRYRSNLQDQRVVEVRLAERQDLARELHDVVAHHVSAIAIQAQAAQAVAETNPAAVLRSLGAIEETASHTLREMRRMVGILRTADERAPMVGTLTLDDLANEPGSPAVRLRGQHHLEGDIPLAVSAAVIRIAQESITNARRHGTQSQPIDVVVSYYDEIISLVITNNTNGQTTSSEGFGLIGMNERATSLGGTLSAGPLSDNRWRVNAQIPIAAFPDRVPSATFTATPSKP